MPSHFVGWVVLLSYNSVKDLTETKRTDLNDRQPGKVTHLPQIFFILQWTPAGSPM